MPVVINDFEVVPEPQEAREREAVAPPPEEQPIVTALELEDRLQRQSERLARVWAH
jgi:hypothetical protein